MMVIFCNLSGDKNVFCMTVIFCTLSGAQNVFCMMLIFGTPSGNKNVFCMMVILYIHIMYTVWCSEHKDSIYRADQGGEFGGGIRCVHYIDHKDSTAGLDAEGIREIPY